MTNIKRSKSKVTKGWCKKLNKTQTARWLSLYEAINMVADTSEEKGLDFEKTPLHIPALKQYVDTTADKISRMI